VYFDLLYNFVCDISLYNKDSARYDHKCGLHVKYRCYSCQVLMKLEFPQENFEKESNIKLGENPCSWSRTVPCGRTDGQRHDEANSLFSQFCKRP